MQARINVQVGKFSKINNCADWNKDLQAGIFIEINKLCSIIIRKSTVDRSSANQGKELICLSNKEYEKNM